MISASDMLRHVARRLGLILLPVIVGLVLAGCSDRSGPSRSGTSDFGAADTPPPVDRQVEAPPKTNPDADAEILSWKEIEQRLASHADKIVVADVWSTSCIPCMRELPHLFALQRKYPDQIVAVTINIDYSGTPDDPPKACKEQALDFLRKRDSVGVHFVSSTEDEKVYEALDAGSIPVVLVYGRDGKLARKFGGTGELSYEKDVIPFVESLLQAGSGKKQ